MSRFFAIPGGAHPPSKSYRFWPPVLLAMVVLLTIIAALQYRWTAEVTGANEFRVGREVESRMIQWHLDLYREFSAICIALQVGPDSGAHDSFNDYLERYVKWSRGEKDQTSVVNLYRNPDLIESVYIWETSRKAPRLRRFNTQTESIDSAAVPPNISAVLDRLQARSANLSAALGAWRLNPQGRNRRADTRLASGGAPPRSGAMTGWQFDETVPLIAHPIVRRDEVTPVDWIIIVLNPETIRMKILPAPGATIFWRTQRPRLQHGCSGVRQYFSHHLHFRTRIWKTRY